MAMATETYSPAFIEAYREERTGEPAWMRELRRRGFDWFSEAGLPTRRDEHWRFFRPGDAFKGDYRFNAPISEDLSPGDLAPYLFPDLDALRMVFVNGRFAPRLSSLVELPSGARALPVRSDLHDENLPRRMGSLVDIDEHPHLALNTALMQDGLFLHLTAGTNLSRPVHVLHLASGDEPAASFPRNLILVEEGARATVLESYASLGGAAHLTMPATEVHLEAASRLEHYRLQRESEPAVQIGWTGISQGRDSLYVSHEISLGGAVLRRGTQVMLEDPKAECRLNGLFLARGKQHMDHQTRVAHQSPDCRTEEVYKGILDDEADAAFGGLILVEQDAQRTDALQSNRNLLLSDNAKVTSLPQLEIYADDVKCSHGSTTGQLDERQVFFLRSRGLDEQEARAMLTYAFAREILEKMELEAVRSRLSEELRLRLPK